jgi:hypothetical protein
MSYDVRKLTIDYIRRTPRWAWLGLITYHAALTWFYLTGRNHDVLMVKRVLLEAVLVEAFLAYYLGVLLQNPAWLGVVRTLPVSQRSIGRNGWWAGIGVPGLCFTVVSMLVLGAATLLGNVTADADQIVIWLIELWAALAIFSSLTLLMVYTARVHPLLGFAVLIPWLIIIWNICGFQSGFGVVPQSIWIAAGLVAMVALYAFSPQLAALPINRRAAKDKNTAFLKSVNSSSNASGWWVLVKLQTASAIAFVFLFAIVLLAIHLILYSKLPSKLYIFFSPALMAVALSSMLSPRMLRALPLTAGRLSAILQIAATAPLAVLFVTVFLLSGSSPVRNPNLFHHFLLILSLQTLCSPIRFRLSFVRAQILISITLMFSLFLLVFGTTFVFGRTYGPAVFLSHWGGVETALAVLIAMTGYFWTRYELVCGSHAYRLRPPSMMGSGVFSGRLPARQSG